VYLPVPQYRYDLPTQHSDAFPASWCWPHLKTRKPTCCFPFSRTHTALQLTPMTKRNNRKRKQPPISAEEQARISARSQAKKAEKKRIYEARRARELAERKSEREVVQAARVADPLFPVVTFCESMGEMPWSAASNNWGFEEEFLSIPMPPPNDTLESVNGVPLKKTLRTETWRLQWMKHLSRRVMVTFVKSSQ
jgi:hypothetical protein